MAQGDMEPLERVHAIRYVEPLREGGSLPALVEADDLGTYVVKFRGAGQGLSALVAEVIVAGLAQRLDIPVPRLAVVDLDEAIARTEPDAEVQALLLASVGSNLGVDFLPRALGYDGLSWRPDPAAAAMILWLDGLTFNVDRSWKNPNLLVWHHQLWAIDHGACLLFQHTWPDVAEFANRPYPIDDHALAPYARGLPVADAELAPLLTHRMLTEVVGRVPDDWLPSDHRPAYIAYLEARAKASANWLPKEAA